MIVSNGAIYEQVKRRFENAPLVSEKPTRDWPDGSGIFVSHPDDLNELYAAANRILIEERVGVLIPSGTTEHEMEHVAAFDQAARAHNQRVVISVGLFVVRHPLELQRRLGKYSLTAATYSNHTFDVITKASIVAHPEKLSVSDSEQLRELGFTGSCQLAEAIKTYNRQPHLHSPLALPRSV